MTALAQVTIPSNDRALMTALASGDLSALGELYDRHAGAMRRFVTRATGDADVAEDIVHDAFLALVDAARRYDDSRPPRSFLMGIAAKLTLRRKRSLAVRLRWLGRLARALRTVDETTPERAAAADEELQRYRSALMSLSEAKRITVLMADVEGMSGPEIASALGVPVGTVWTRLHHGRARLRKALGREVSP